MPQRNLEGIGRSIIKCWLGWLDFWNWYWYVVVHLLKEGLSEYFHQDYWFKTIKIVIETNFYEFTWKSFAIWLQQSTHSSEKCCWKASSFQTKYNPVLMKLFIFIHFTFQLADSSLKLCYEPLDASDAICHQHRRLGHSWFWWYVLNVWIEIEP